ncbi:hypothetical protein TNCV_2320021 [Trichonephila clavipes]|nr:hypothetical protein TNCV_2320021 [Trichonephila clavipes]
MPQMLASIASLDSDPVLVLLKTNLVEGLMHVKTVVFQSPHVGVGCSYFVNGHFEFRHFVVGHRDARALPLIELSRLPQGRRAPQFEKRCFPVAQLRKTLFLERSSLFNGRHAGNWDLLIYSEGENFYDTVLEKLISNYDKCYNSCGYYVQKLK